MLMPQEIEVWYILPAIRRHLAVALHEKGMKQKEIAFRLDLAKSAVSQYLKGRRGKSINFDNEIINEVKKSAEVLIKEPIKLMEIMQNLLKFIRQKKVVCKMHLNDGKIPKGCEVCLR